MARGYNGRHFVRMRAIRHGDMLDLDIYPVFQLPGKRRGKCKPTSEVQAKLNQRNRERHATRLLNANFGEMDIFLTLTYDQEPECYAQAARNLRNFLRRVGYRRKKLGLEPLKYMATTEQGKRSGRWHHHIVMSGGLDRDLLEELWGLGYANSKRLQRGDEGFDALGRYLCKSRIIETDDQTGEVTTLQWQHWTQSRNLTMPEEQTEDGALSVRELEELREAVEDGRGWELAEALYEDYEVLEAEAVKNGINQGSYVRFVLRRKRPEQRQKQYQRRAG